VPEELRRLDELLRSHAIGADLDDLLRTIAAQNLWPGLRRPKDVPAYLQSISGAAADLVVASLLILLQQDDSVLDRASWRPMAGTLLSRNIQRLEPYVAPPKEKGAHAVFTACAGAVSAIEADFRSEVARFADVRRARALKNGVLRRLNGKAGSLVFRPFIPPGVSDRELDGLLSAVADLDTTDAQVADARFAELQVVATRCRSAADEIGTSFARLILGETAEAVQRVATRTNELTKPPATLEIQARTRPLPLREPGVTCEVALQLRNTSEVRASQVRIRYSVTSEAVSLEQESIDIEALGGLSSVSLSTVLSVLQASDGQVLAVELEWRNPDHSASSSTTTLSLEAQTADVDWEFASVLEPFAPYPIEEARQLVGRGQLLGQLLLRFRQLPLSNIYVTGQRRVGKTSLVRVLTHELEGQDDKTIVASVEMGEVRRDDGRETIGELGRALGRKLISRAGVSELIDAPMFDATLAPLNGLVDDLRSLDERLKFVFVIDEFDELPDDMFQRGGPGDAIFLPIRALAQKPFVGWVLVGGERMPFIRDEQAARLNTFGAVAVDYLDFVEQGATTASAGSFYALVQDPLPPGFKVSADGVARIHALTLGNPHFAKELCAVMYQDAVRRRDPLLEQRDVEHAAGLLASRSDFELFAHFWEDGIFSNRSDVKRRVELERRHFLVALGETGRTGRATPEGLQQAAERHGLSAAAVTRTRADLLRRQVVVESNARIRAKVPLFASWLEDEGVYKLTPRGISERDDAAFRVADEAARVSEEEVRRLVRRWRSFRFRGEAITHEGVSSWLRQFATDSERRIMFRLLERFVLLSEADFASGLRQLHRLVAKPDTLSFDRGQRSFSHVLVAGMGSAGSSGQMVAYKYRQVNNIRQRNLVELAQVAQRAADDSIKAVVLLDDVIGTGGTAKKALADLAAAELRNLSTYVFAVTGVPDGLAKLEKAQAAQRLSATVEVAHPLLAQQSPFADGSPVFGSVEEQLAAREVVESYGRRLAPTMPLGYQSQALLVVLPDNCPNNVPPVFWSDADNWHPLFPRTAR
jgi:hypothetical protein